MTMLLIQHEPSVHHSVLNDALNMGGPDSLGRFIYQLGSECKIFSYKPKMLVIMTFQIVFCFTS